MRKSNFRVKVMLILIASMLFIGGLSQFIIYRYALHSQFEQLRDKLKAIARTSVLMIDADTLMAVPLNHEGLYSPAYKTIRDNLKKIKEANAPIKYIYTMAKTDKEGVLQFIVDADPIGRDGERKLTSFPGDKYDATRFPQMLKAFDRPTADKQFGTDEWGMLMSGYAPVVNKEGKTVAVLGVDMTAGDVITLQKEVHRRALFVLILGVVFALILGVWFSNRIAAPLKKLTAGMRRISSGELRHHVEAGASDEIGELARAFNKMALDLYEAKRKIHSYFYGVIQSFVRLVEARDHYTRGHSERVADYAQMIAVKLKLPQEKIELIRETALLHDIGKLGVRESILNKQGALTEEEWEVIRKHPVIGEDILKPILLNEEMLAIVREHHERFDGKGYPDKLRGDKINIYAQILSVADAYDAMTSSRAYRPAFSKEKAVAELEKNRGTQFNPKVVDALIAVLEEQKED